jgi:hypothetical protein
MLELPLGVVSLLAALLPVAPLEPEDGPVPPAPMLVPLPVALLPVPAVEPPVLPPALGVEALLSVVPEEPEVPDPLVLPVWARAKPPRARATAAAKVVRVFLVVDM